MPYIKQDKRMLVGYSELPTNAGELNYVLTIMILSYMKLMGDKYQTYNDVLGVLEAIKQELYRRKIAPYEDQKIRDNGDVYE